MRNMNVLDDSNSNLIHAHFTAPNAGASGSIEILVKITPIYSKNALTLFNLNCTCKLQIANFSNSHKYYFFRF